jgi:putative hydrolase of HD superfamily
LTITPLEVIERQLLAYNSKDIEALMSTYDIEAEQFTLHGELLAKGHAELRQRFLSRFSEPDLYARLLSRNVMGNIVIDFELITRNFSEGIGTLEMLCIYEIKNGLIQKASFAIGEKRLN